MRRFFLILIALATVALVYGDMKYGSLIIKPDETLYIQIAQEMRAHHEFLVPTLEGKPTFIKPPLVYWLELSGFKVFGESVWSARFPVWILGLLSVWFVLQIGKLFGSERAGWTAAILLLTNFFFFTYSQSDMMDVPLTFFVLASFYSFIRARRNPRMILLCSASIGLVTLVKGPIGVLLCFLPICLYAFHFNAWAIFKHPLIWPSLGIFIMLGAAWPLFLASKGYGHAWFSEFIVGENFGKFSEARMPFTILLVGLLGGIVPWTFLFLESFWKGVRQLRQSPEKAFLVEWILGVLLIFAIPSRKLPHYVMPAIPAVSLLIAGTEGWSRITLRLTQVVLAVFAIVWILSARLTHLSGVVWIMSAAGIAILLSLLALEKRNLVRCALLFGLALLTFPIIAPALESGEQTQVVRTLRFPVGVFCPGDRDPQGFEIASNVVSCPTLEEARRLLVQGGILIYAQHNQALLEKLGPGPSFYLERTWKVWRKGIGLGDVTHAIWTGDPSGLQEEMRAVTLHSLRRRDRLRDGRH